MRNIFKNYSKTIITSLILLIFFVLEIVFNYYINGGIPDIITFTSLFLASFGIVVTVLIYEKSNRVEEIYKNNLTDTIKELTWGREEKQTKETINSFLLNFFNIDPLLGNSILEESELKQYIEEEIFNKIRKGLKIEVNEINSLQDRLNTPLNTLLTAKIKEKFSMNQSMSLLQLIYIFNEHIENFENIPFFEIISYSHSEFLEILWNIPESIECNDYYGNWENFSISNNPYTTDYKDKFNNNIEIIQVLLDGIESSLQHFAMSERDMKIEAIFEYLSSKLDKYNFIEKINDKNIIINYLCGMWPQYSRTDNSNHQLWNLHSFAGNISKFKLLRVSNIQAKFMKIWAMILGHYSKNGDLSGFGTSKADASGIKELIDLDYIEYNKTLLKYEEKLNLLFKSIYNLNDSNLDNDQKTLIELPDINSEEIYKKSLNTIYGYITFFYISPKEFLRNKNAYSKEAKRMVIDELVNSKIILWKTEESLGPEGSFKSGGKFNLIKDPEAIYGNINEEIWWENLIKEVDIKLNALVKMNNFQIETGEFTESKTRYNRSTDKYLSKKDFEDDIKEFKENIYKYKKEILNVYNNIL